MIEAYQQFEIHQSGTKTGEKAEVIQNSYWKESLKSFVDCAKAA